MAGDDTNDPMPRRRFLAITCAGLCGATAAAIGGPVIVAFLSPHKRRTVTGGGEPIDVGPVDDLPIGVPQKRDVIAERRDAWDRLDPATIGAIWLVRGADHVSAFSSVCPHLGCSIGFDEAKQVFFSPCHESAFAKNDGARLKGPAPRGMDPLPLSIENGRIHVTYKRFVLGIKQRKEV